MAGKRRPKPFIKNHKDGTVWAKGQTIDDAPTGFWDGFARTGRNCDRATSRTASRSANGRRTTGTARSTRSRR
jgi:hypothetical protein